MGTVPTKKSGLMPEQRPTAALQLYLETILYKTRERLELINITRDLNDVVRKHGLKAGFVIVQSLHTTTAVFINEFQQALVDDMKSFLERLVGRLDYWRHNDPRYSAENMPANLAIVDAVAKVAGHHGVSNAQVALAWLLAQGDDIVPIPGVKRLEPV